MITLSILGSTGSIGLNVLNIVNKKKKLFTINLLSANKNYKIICNQILQYNPNYFFIFDKKKILKVKKKFKNKKVKILNNLNNFKIRKKLDTTISAIPGIAGLEPTLLMINFSKKIIIANKESIVCGWNLIKNKAKINKTKIVPVDSEHFSIFKLLENHKISEIRTIYITASGGPFLNIKKNLKIKPKDAIMHPKWKMEKN